MSSFILSLSERRALAKQIQGTKDAKILKRAQTVLWLSDGMTVQEISKRFGISRQTIYYWVSSYQIRSDVIRLLKVGCKIVQNQDVLQGRPRSFCESLPHCLMTLRDNTDIRMPSGRHRC
jgi:DNA-binding CsgD family transcriptional regulator